MTAVLDELDADGDPVLLTRVRAGDTDAYAELFLRHRAAALGFARSLAGTSGADDLVAEAFAKVLSALQRNLGPTVSFRSYLLATIRSLHLNGIRDESRLRLVEDYETLPPEPLTVDEDAIARFDNATIANAFRSLPERWQAVLWYSTVEGLSNEEIGRHLGLKANAVGQLSYRAREGLRQAYLDQHLAKASEERCREVLALLPASVRGSVDKRKKPGIAEHLAGCDRCAAAMADLDGVNRRLGAMLLPIVLGAGADRLGWPKIAGPTVLRRLVATVSLKTALVALVALVTGAAVLGLPLGWYALGVDHGRASAEGSDATRPQPGYGPYALQLGVPHRPNAPTTSSQREAHAEAQAAVRDDDRAVPVPRVDRQPGHRLLATAPVLSPSPSTGRAPHPGQHDGARPHRRHPQGHRAGPAQHAAPTSHPSSVHDVRVGPVSVTRTGPVGVAVVVPLANLLPHATVTLDFTGLASAPIGRSAGWTCTSPGLQAGGTATLTCVYDARQIHATTLEVSAVAAGTVRVTVTVANPAGVKDPAPANNSVTSSVA